VEDLARFNIFRGLQPDKLAKIGEIIQVEEVPDGATVIRDGDEGGTFYLLLEGEVEITKVLVMRMSRQEVDQTDKSLIQLSSEPHPEFGKPCFGEMALFSDKSRRSATVVTTQASVLGVIHHERFMDLCEADKEIGYRVFRSIAGMLSTRLDKANQDVLNLTTALSFVLASH
jgi:CRP-like cAMP-binding protein